MFFDWGDRKNLKKFFSFLEFALIIFVICYLIFIIFFNKAMGFYCVINNTLTNCTENTTKIIVDSREKCEEFCYLQGYNETEYMSKMFEKICECYNKERCFNKYLIRNYTEGYTGNLSICPDV